MHYLASSSLALRKLYMIIRIARKVVGGEQQKAHEVEKVYLREPCPYNSDELKDMCKKVKKDLFVSQEERVKIELNTTATVWLFTMV